MNPPAAGRLRQVLANAVRTRLDKSSVVPHLLRWRAFESDEFAKRAIEAALDGVDTTAFTHGALGDTEPTLAADSLASAQAITIYRWVASRLCHRVRNAMVAPTTTLHRLNQLIERIPDPALASEFALEVSTLSGPFERLFRVVGFNIDDPYFAWREIALWAWLREMTVQYGSRYEPIELTITGPASNIQVTITGNDVLLETVFWNLWQNAAQVVDGPCCLEINANIDSNNVVLLLSDNGPGFEEAQADEAFHSPISTKGAEHGRGLLEVAEAVERLHGRAGITRADDQTHRVRLVIPRSRS